MTGSPASRPVLEIAANSLASALAAQAGGADRIELCSALEIGGVTPSAGLIALVQAQLRIPVYVLIRPRGGDFVYTDDEHQTILADIAHCRAAGCAGVVIGALDADGGVDMPRCRAMLAEAGAMGVTFHRAIDVSRDPRATLEQIIELGCERVLSSGAASSAPAGASLLQALVAQAAGRITVMPGAGIDADNVAALRDATGAIEFHASAKQVLAPAGRWRPTNALGMGDGEVRSDAAQVARLRAALGPAAATP